jgi:transposase, IS30 family
MEQRASIVDKKSRIGDLEGDTVSGKNHQGFIVTLVDRRSRYTFAAPVNTKEALPVAEAIIAMLRPHKQVCHTITFDNGTSLRVLIYAVSCSLKWTMLCMR